MKNFFRALLLLLVIAFTIYIYARFVEPNMLRFHYNSIDTNYISNNHDEIKILQFSDIHLSDYFNVDDLQEIVDKINDENPDIVVFTGDLIDHYNDSSYKGDISDIWDILEKIRAPIGKFAVYGNHDYGGGAEKVYSEIMKRSGFITLINRNMKLDEYNLNIVGLDDSIFGNLDKDKLTKSIYENYYNVVISHEPDVVDYFLEYNIDLFLAGHSHGGQVNLPIFSSAMLPPLGEKYVRGIYNFENSRNTVLYVNIGIGTSQIPLRFMAVPEISVLTLKYK